MNGWRVLICIGVVVISNSVASFAQFKKIDLGWPTFTPTKNEDGSFRLVMWRNHHPPDQSLMERSKAIAVFSDPRVLSLFDLTPGQLQKFEALYATIQSNVKSTIGSYDSVQASDPHWHKVRGEFVGSQEKLFVNETEKILLPHQMKLLKQMRFGHDVRYSSFIKVLTTDPVAEELSISSRQKESLEILHKTLFEEKRKKQAKILAKHRQQLFEGVSFDSKNKIIKALGKDFFDDTPDRSFLNEHQSDTVADFGIADALVKDNGGEKQPYVFPRPVRSWEPYSGPFGLPLYLLSLEDVVKDVEITARQKSELKKEYKRWRQELNELYPIFDAMPTKERSRKFLGFRQRIRRESKEKLEEILMPFQVERLQQIHNQRFVEANSLKAFLLHKTTQEKFGLSVDERKLVNAIDINRMEGSEKTLTEQLMKFETEYRDELVREGLEKNQQEKAVELFGKEFFGRK